MYAFVGISGMAKMSSSRGGVPTPADALEIMEAPLLRWLYARRRPNQSFNVAFDQEMQRLYDEWDALCAQGRRRHGAARRTWPRTPRAVAPRPGRCRTTPRPLPYRTLASVVDITTGRRRADPADPARPRPRRPGHLAGRAAAPARPARSAGSTPRCRPSTAPTCAPSPTRELLGSRWTSTRGSRCGCSSTGCDDHWSLDGLTTLVYGVPKVQAGLPPDAKAATPELKAAQRQFFALLYRLLIGKDTGPRLPTLLLAVGEDRLRHLIGAA